MADPLQQIESVFPIYFLNHGPGTAYSVPVATGCCILGLDQHLRQSWQSAPFFVVGCCNGGRVV